LVSCGRAGVHGPLPEKRLDQLAEEEPEPGDPQLHLKDAAGNPLALRAQIAVEDLVLLIPPTAYRAVTVRTKPIGHLLWLCGCLDWTKWRLVVSFKSAELTGTYVVLVTNRVDWDAQRIITLYLQRWPIETFLSGR